MKSARFEARWLLCVLLVACHSLPAADTEPPLSPDETAINEAGAPDSAGSATDGDTRPDAGGGGNGAGDAQPDEAAGSMGREPGDAPSAAAGSRDLPGPPGCTSAQFRGANESEGETMNPGFPCIACHAATNSASSDADAPLLAFAGTLYPSLHEPNSCLASAAEGAEVVLNDAAGRELRAIANSSGNFMLKEEGTLTAPFSVTVSFDGRARAATTAHQNGDCNLCHTQGGDLGAPGRVILP